MKPKLYSALALFLACCLTACTTTFRPWNLSKIETGMSRGQVIAILGEPDRAEVKENEERLFYNYREDYNPSLADDEVRISSADRMMDQRRFSRSMKEYRYVVLLVDGAVQHYEELTD